jgi:predicted NodU family carbamoyl transferase
MLEANLRAQRSGMTAVGTERKRWHTLREDRTELQEAIKAVSPEDQRQFATRFAKFQQMQTLSTRIMAEFSQASLDRQAELMHTIALSYETELAAEERAYVSGGVAGNVYSNRYFGFSLDFPATWRVVTTRPTGGAQ